MFNFIRARHLFLVLCILIAIALRLFLFLNTDHLDGESIYRISDAYRFSLHPLNIVQQLDILESGCGQQMGYYFTTSILMHFIDEPVLVARLTSFTFGILGILAYYFLVILVFPLEIALASVFALVFYSIHVQLSVVSMAKAGNILFVILAVFSLIKYLTTNTTNKRYFVASIFFTILATSFRMESFFLVFFFPLLLIQQKRLKDACLFFIFSSLYITTLLFMFYYKGTNIGAILIADLCHPNMNHSYLERILRFLLSSNTEGMPRNFPYQIFVWFFVLIKTFSFPLFVLGFLGMKNAFKDKKKYIFLMCFIGFFFCSTIRLMISNQPTFVRYSYVFGIFFIPFIFLGIMSITRHLVRPLFFLHTRYKIALTICCVILVNYYFMLFSLNYLVTHIPDMKYSISHENFYGMIKWHEQNIRSGDIVVYCVVNEFPTLRALALTRNKLINVYDHNDIDALLNAPGKDTKYKLMINQIKDIIHQHPPQENRTSPYFVLIYSLIKKNDLREGKRIVLIIDDEIYTRFKDSERVFLNEIDVHYNGIFYYAILEL